MAENSYRKVHLTEDGVEAELIQSSDMMCGHPRRDPPIASATAMRMTAIRTQTERKRQDRSVRRAEKNRRRARTRRLRGLIRPVPAACATEDAGWGEKSLSSGQGKADLNVSGHATWGMPVIISLQFGRKFSGTR